MSQAEAVTRVTGWTPELTTSEGSTVIRLDKIAAITLSHEGYLDIFTIDDTVFTVLAYGGSKGVKALRDELMQMMN